MTKEEIFDIRKAELRMKCAQITLTVLGPERAHLTPILAEQIFNFVIDGDLPSTEKIETLKSQLLTTFSAS